jgi:hypothetical protein
MSSNRGAEAPLPRPVKPAGLWVVGQQLAVLTRIPTMTTSNNEPTAASSSRKASKAGANKANQISASASERTVPAGAPKAPSKQEQLAALVVRDEGATLDQMIAAMGWLPHTTRAALTGLKKKGYVISSDKVDGVRTYRAVAPE